MEKEKKLKNSIKDKGCLARYCLGEKECLKKWCEAELWCKFHPDYKEEEND